MPRMLAAEFSAADLAAGRSRVLDSSEAFLSSLEE